MSGSSLGRRTSGEFASALESALSHGTDDFLTRDEVTIDQIHSLSTGSPLKGLGPFDSGSLLTGASLPYLNTDQAPEPTDHEAWLSPSNGAGSDALAAGTYLGSDGLGHGTSPGRGTGPAASSDRGSRGSLGGRSSASSSRELTDSGSSKPKPSGGVPRVASLARSASKKTEDLASKPSAHSSFTSRTSQANSSKALNSGASRSSVASRTNSGTRLPTSPGALSPAVRTASATSGGRPSAASPVGNVKHTSPLATRVSSSPALTRPTPPSGGSTSSIGRNVLGPPSRTTSRGALSPNGVASRTSSYSAASSRIKRPGGNAEPSPDAKHPTGSSRVLGSTASTPSPATKPTATGARSVSRTSSYSQGPSGKYAGASSTKAPARKALEDIMSELQEVKHQLGLPISGARRSSGGAEVPHPEEAVAAEAAPVPVVATAPLVAVGLPVEAPPAPVAAEPVPTLVPAPVVEEKVVFNISISEPEADDAEKSAPGAAHDKAAEEAHGAKYDPTTSPLPMPLPSAEEPQEETESAPERKEEAAPAHEDHEVLATAKEDVITAGDKADGAESTPEDEAAAAAVAATADLELATLEKKEQVEEEEKQGDEQQQPTKEAERKEVEESSETPAVQVMEGPADATADVTGVIAGKENVASKAEAKPDSAIKKCTCCVVM